MLVPPMNAKNTIDRACENRRSFKHDRNYKEITDNHQKNVAENFENT